jgi:NADPH:quinone reductase
MMDTQFPLILGFDGAGRVEALGSSADRFAVGELVHGQIWGDALSRGTLAELVAVNEHPSRGALELVPPDLDLDLAAAVPTSGMTAVGALERTVCRPGDTVLILGATGGVGVRSRQHSPRSTATASMTSPEPISSTANGSGGSPEEGGPGTTARRHGMFETFGMRRFAGPISFRARTLVRCGLLPPPDERSEAHEQLLSALG